MRNAPFQLVEMTVCRKCGIVFKRASECPRCGKSDGLEVYLETKE
jgi:predicted Zn-ribbon and HTH transcriptional regulator